MAFRTATKHVDMPGMAMKLKRVMDGMPSNLITPLGWRDCLTRRFAIYGLGYMGFTEGYFDAEFLDGAKHALRHVTRNLPNAGTRKEAYNWDSCDAFDVKLRDLCIDAIGDLDAEGLRLSWNIEEISSVSLGKFQMVFGLRRRALPLPRGSFAHRLGPHCIIVRDTSIGSPSEALLASFQHGATLTADVFITCRQSVSLLKSPTPVKGRKVTEDEDMTSEHIVVQSMREPVTHCLKLEAELFGSETFNNAEEADSGVPGLRFNDTRGWTIVDLNQVLGGNCVSAQVRSRS